MKRILAGLALGAAMLLPVAASAHPTQHHMPYHGRGINQVLSVEQSAIYGGIDPYAGYTYGYGQVIANGLVVVYPNEDAYLYEYPWNSIEFAAHTYGGDRRIHLNESGYMRR